MEKLYVLAQNSDGQDVEVEVNKDIYDTMTNEYKTYKTDKRKMERNNVTIETIEDCDVIADTNCVEKEFEINELLKEVFDILDTCSEEQRRRYYLKYFKDVAIVDIALMENVSVSAIEKSIYQVKRKIKNTVNMDYFS